MTMKAIETRYMGYRFRSRLEARWAVYFEHEKKAGRLLSWEYEPEGFHLGVGVYYLPDFRIVRAGFRQYEWVEIKGTKPTFTERYALAMFAHELKKEQQQSSYVVVCLVGTPHIGMSDRHSGLCGLVAGYVLPLRDDLVYFTNHLLEEPKLRRYNINGIRAMLSARFEHGESP